MSPSWVLISTSTPQYWTTPNNTLKTYVNDKTVPTPGVERAMMPLQSADFNVQLSLELSFDDRDVVRYDSTQLMQFWIINQCMLIWYYTTVFWLKFDDGEVFTSTISWLCQGSAQLLFIVCVSTKKKCWWLKYANITCTVLSTLDSADLHLDDGNTSLWAHTVEMCWLLHAKRSSDWYWLHSADWDVIIIYSCLLNCWLQVLVWRSG